MVVDAKKGPAYFHTLCSLAYTIDILEWKKWSVSTEGFLHSYTTLESFGNQGLPS